MIKHNCSYYMYIMYHITDILQYTLVYKPCTYCRFAGQHYKYYLYYQKRCRKPRKWEASMLSSTLSWSCPGRQTSPAHKTNKGANLARQEWASNKPYKLSGLLNQLKQWSRPNRVSRVMQGYRFLHDIPFLTMHECRKTQAVSSSSPFLKE